jgi:hypothetical protein
MRRIALVLTTVAAMTLAGGGAALACGGLIGPNGAVNLLRTTTFAGYHQGVEHYVTAFKFIGGGGEFGSIVPLPGVPSNVEKGGDWTLQRLIRETAPIRRDAIFAAALGSKERAEELFRTRIDALDVIVLKGGADAVGLWAKEHGFRLPPDAPEVLDFYARRSPIFLAAIFDSDAALARGQNVGDGTPVHITIPTPNPWVPLRILGLGKADVERVEADVFLLTDREPTLLPGPTRRGLTLTHSSPATKLLLDDLRSDRGMEWIPESGWLTQVSLDTAAADLTYDLAVDASGQGAPSRIAAGFDAVELSTWAADRSPWALGLAVLAVLGAIIIAAAVARPLRVHA